MADKDKLVICFLAVFLFCAPHSYPCDVFMQINAWPLGAKLETCSKDTCFASAQGPLRSQAVKLLCSTGLIQLWDFSWNSRVKNDPFAKQFPGTPDEM